MTAPILHTKRLTLRMPILADFEYRAAFYASDRSVWEDGPMPRAQAWRVWASEVAQWPLMGFGPFSLEDRQSRQYLGEVGVYRPEGFPEPELGWFVLPEAEGRGYAAEAARAVMGWVRKTFGWDHLVSYIAPGNLRSIALALRIGGRKVTDRPGTADDDVVILHDLRGIA
ncbi:MULTISPECIES: GNAT family N-acetyltransferase [Actibacterium]|uniref:RimJ/RimL family protein N-acetyltransferase n=1 Tax=Actibacterium naphthalenivorans TaxID=1614693 RepID=A0A840CBR2_9RHOB|nr:MULTISPECIES: GNAT family N-acetyltransferase [Actibacterium]ALG91100.1 acetyltransferase [Actibacterium sp. EMB200-NS6]MBB4023504.1 RimJ/RimL family protein N-acetyltransferase [Actibacterium naphthalenivorans]